MPIFQIVHVISVRSRSWWIFIENCTVVMEQQILALDSRYSAYRAPNVPGFSECIAFSFNYFSLFILGVRSYLCFQKLCTSEEGPSCWKIASHRYKLFPAVFLFFLSFLKFLQGNLFQQEKFFYWTDKLHCQEVGKNTKKRGIIWKDMFKTNKSNKTPWNRWPLAIHHQNLEYCFSWILPYVNNIWRHAVNSFLKSTAWILIQVVLESRSAIAVVVKWHWKWVFSNNITFPTGLFFLLLLKKVWFSFPELEWYYLLNSVNLSFLLASQNIKLLTEWLLVSLKKFSLNFLYSVLISIISVSAYNKYQVILEAPQISSHANLHYFHFRPLSFLAYHNHYNLSWVLIGI